MNIVTIEEKKFLISIEKFRNKSHYLDSLLFQNEQNGTDGYIIRQLYFNMIYDNLFEKLDRGRIERKKINI